MKQQHRGGGGVNGTTLLQGTIFLENLQQRNYNAILQNNSISPGEGRKELTKEQMRQMENK